VKKTILLVNPWIYDFAAYDFWIKPLGLLYVGSFLRQNGFDIRLVDCLDPYHPGMPFEPSVHRPKRKPFGQGKFAKEKISKPEPFRDIPRSYHRYGITPRIFKEEILQGGRPALVMVTSMMTYWYPGVFDLVRRLDQVPILTSRGCPFRCTYCASGLLNKRFRRRDPLKVADEITFWNHSRGIRDFSLYDDAFLVNPQVMAIPLLEEIIKRDLKCRFHCPNGLHLREVNDTIARLLFKAGFVTLRFGFESANSDAQIETGGKVSNEELLAAVRSLKKAGYPNRDIGIYLLCGLPGQKASEIRESIRFVQSCGARPILAEFSPIPGTALWEWSLRTSIYPIGDDPLFHNNSLLPCGSEDLTHEDFKALKRLARET
jgi:pyruvate-formate lyase-activating enzyme